MDSHFLFFFLDDFHQGAINHLAHFIGFTLLGFGLGRKSWKIILISPLIMELGHIYNYAHGMHQELALQIVPFQLLGWIVFVIAGYLVAKVFNRQKQ